MLYFVVVIAGAYQQNGRNHKNQNIRLGKGVLRRIEQAGKRRNGHGYEGRTGRH